MQITGTKVKFEWAKEPSPPKNSWAFHIWRAVLTEDVNSEELSEIIGKNVTSPDGIFCRIRGIQSVPLENQSVGLPINLALEALERPF